MVISCLPDTGCSQTLMSCSIARQLRCTLIPNTDIRLLTADGNQMAVAGLADLSITNNNNNNLVEIKTRVIVTKNPAHPALISWHDMVRLNIIHEESSKLTTFILPSGRYRYKRIPQGLNASSDEWCRRSAVVI